ncbi:patatin-like phospholipase family protein [Streptomyces sp. NPDC051555]|uniref:patatin-like phospholipase family protein n=1 Tax=Streptomyces sp. NPDC051555 TaxID=3365657 RepID=UPI00379C8455
MTPATPVTPPAPETPAAPDRALVLGPGGLVGTAWTAGLAAGLRRAGVEFGEADLIVGTSAGAIVGALLATDQDLDRLAVPVRPPGTPAQRPVVDPAVLGRCSPSSVNPAWSPRRPAAASVGSPWRTATWRPNGR